MQRDKYVNGVFFFYHETNNAGMAGRTKAHGVHVNRTKLLQ